MSSIVENLERGLSGTEKTIERMHSLVAKGKLDPTLQKIATWIRLQVPKDERGSTTAMLDRLFWWVRKHRVFQRDPFQIEKLEHPIEAFRPVIEARKNGTYRGPGLFVGDCDTVSGVVLATLGGILGFHYAFETAKVDPSRPDEFSHVWVAFRVGDRWYPLDPSTSSARPGWRPEVPADRFRRWAEGPIENTGVGFLAEDESGEDPRRDEIDPRGYYPSEEFGYSQPKSFGPGDLPGQIPVPAPGDIDQLVPDATQLPAANLIDRRPPFGGGRRPTPAERIGPIADQPEDAGPPYYRDQIGRQRYLKVESEPYPPGSIWNRTLGRDRRKFPPLGPYVQSQNPGTPERQVEVKVMQPIPIRRRTSTVVVEPERLTPGGMGDPVPGIVTSLDDNVSPYGTGTDAAGEEISLAPPSSITPQQQQAAKAGSNVWDSISSLFTGAAKVAATPGVQSSIAGAVARATNKVAGTNVAQVGAKPGPSILKSPWFWGFTAVAVGGGAYVLLKSKPSSGGTRRYRRR
jgi:hypothetical protein